MTTTSGDNDHVDQEDIKMEEDDLTPHQSHPGTENPENPTPSLEEPPEPNRNRSNRSIPKP